MPTLTTQAHSSSPETTVDIEQKAPLDEPFLDFIGQCTLNFNSIDPIKSSELIHALNENRPLSWILLHIFKNNSDDLARSATLAFKNQYINRQQMSTILQYRELLSIVTHCEQLSLEEDKGTQAQSWFQDLVPLAQRQQFFQDLSQLPLSEHCCFIVSFLPASEELTQLLQFAVDTHIIKQSKPDAHVVLSTSVLALLNTYQFGSHAKKLLPSLGDFSIDDIDRGEQGYGRYIACDHPDIISSLYFHDIEAPAFYKKLHDLLHWKLISSVPNYLFGAYREAIELVRSVTKIKWSRDIWNAIDLETMDFLNQSKQERNSEYDNDRTSNFCKLLSTQVLSDEISVGLFDSNHAFVDTTLIVMVDLYKNPEKWAKFGIISGYLSAEYAALYSLISSHPDLVEGEDVAVQIAQLKSILIKQPLADPQQQVIAFKKVEKYIQLIFTTRS